MVKGMASVAYSMFVIPHSNKLKKAEYLLDTDLILLTLRMRNNAKLFLFLNQNICCRYTKNRLNELFKK